VYVCQAFGIVTFALPAWNSSAILWKSLSWFHAMADWQAESFASQTQPSLDGVGRGTHRALQHTSGNAQSYADGAASAMNGDGGSHHDDHLQTLALKYPPAPVPFHHSVSGTGLHDSHVLAARLQAKKLRRLQSAAHPMPTMRPRRSYLKSQKYLEYRARPRRDTGKDGEPVWSDALEDAFQQGECQHSLYTVCIRHITKDEQP
jgi:transcriptional enhancer factor